jgi:hypothetical protein
VCEDEQVLLDGERGVEVVEPGRDAELGARLLGLLGQLEAEQLELARVRDRLSVRSRIVVDFPAPLGPSKPTQVPSGTSRSSPSTAVMAP